jgi:hypothetical protein
VSLLCRSGIGLGLLAELDVLGRWINFLWYRNGDSDELWSRLFFGNLETTRN